MSQHGCRYVDASTCCDSGLWFIYFLRQPVYTCIWSFLLYYVRLVVSVPGHGVPSQTLASGVV